MFLTHFDLGKFIASEWKVDVDVSVMWGWPTYMQDLPPPRKDILEPKKFSSGLTQHSTEHLHARINSGQAHTIVCRIARRKPPSGLPFFGVRPPHRFRGIAPSNPDEDCGANGNSDWRYTRLWVSWRQIRRFWVRNCSLLYSTFLVCQYSWFYVIEIK